MQRVWPVGVLVVVSYVPVVGERVQDFNAVRVQAAVPGADEHECSATVAVDELLEGGGRY